MLDLVATLTWRRPKLILALTGVFLLVAGALGHDVEHRLKAAGLTDGASHSERATASLFKQHLLKLSTTGWTLHQLRHSALTHLAEAGIHLPC
jgi:hypothetical protein